ncbi:MAG: 2-amino-4-hydroxy-6-hydroxymethyldihydropteridine diphosphokinase [Janthinobacterium lividum]
MPLAAIALGSNLGDRERTLIRALGDLHRLGNVTAASTFLDTEPVGYLDQPRFLNAAALLETQLSPSELLRALLEIEGEHGRDRSHGISKGPRTLDLDLLLYDDAVMSTGDLVLPHPELHRRGFVLQPLAQVAPDWLHPTLRLTVVQMLRKMSQGD